MAVVIDNRSDISGIGKVSGLGASWDFDIGEKIKALYSKKKASPAVKQVSDETVAPVPPVTPPYVPTWKDKVAEQWSKPAVKAGVGAVGVLAAYLAWKKWKK